MQCHSCQDYIQENHKEQVHRAVLRHPVRDDPAKLSPFRLRLVIKTKSVEFMPFFLSLFVFLCGTSWFIFGLLGRDPFVAVPNGFGCGLGAIQLILYFIYRKNKGKDAAAAKQPTSESLEWVQESPSKRSKWWQMGDDRLRRNKVGDYVESVYHVGCDHLFVTFYLHLHGFNLQKWSIKLA
ncbi:hypothetical protein GH714_021733 [Hevea brasiliensis]|uniref:Bidirectional sugar transporter SWEET n=1 Tax=Hevea brasiliensis TaxID=3981 RepID=A0A6A6M0L1_HEVBR|nr:hypothetical protein GH714_021733 [Hevea brasiliensis]